ncbi:hypothetical protein [Streptomyces bluensis]|uniref:Syndecan 1 n=1 Tax=Streptomyces bluensis TaxID=33897 RepID=A0ABW6UCE0_9ACTN
MAWRDRLRRRAAGAFAAAPSRRTERHGATAGGPSGGDSERGVARGSGSDVPGRAGAAGTGGPGPSVPGDWDGGWRRTTAPELTVSRAPLGVSDGLAFRAGLAAWQNPSFDAGLGHALLPTAPTGLVRGVARPAAPQATRTGGGPLLLRALRPEGPAGPHDGASDAGMSDAGTARGGTSGGTARPSSTGVPQVAHRTRPGARSGTASSGTESSGTASSGSVLSDGVSSGPVPSDPRPSPSGSRRAGTADAGSGPEPVVASPGGNSTAGKGRSGDAQRSRGITSADSPAVLSASASSSPPSVQRAAEPGIGPVVTPADTGRRPVAPEIPLVRRVSVVPGRAVDRAATRPDPEGPAPQARSGPPKPDSGRVSGSPAGTGARTPSGPDGRRTATGTTGPRPAQGSGQPQAPRASGADTSHPAIRLRPAGPSLTVARRPPGPVRRVPALRPATTPAFGNGTEGSGRPSTTTAPSGTRARSATPAQGAATRAPLGAPLSELPSTAARLAQGAAVPPSASGAGAASGPALPVVQRRAEGTAGTPAPHDGGARATAHGTPDSGAAPADTPHRPSVPTGTRVRGGLGAPLPALPPSADLARATRSAEPAPDGRGAPVRQDRGSADAPARPTTDRERTPTETASRPTGGHGADAPLLGASDVQRRLAADSAGRSTSEPGPAHHGNGPATPLVTAVGEAGTAGAAGDARGPGTTPGGGPGSGGQRHRGPAAPGPVVVARTVVEGTSGVSGARPFGPAEPHPFTVSRSAAHSAPAAPRTLSLLAARPLSLNTRPPEGAARPAAARPGGRPVVAARWPGTAAAAQGNPVPPARDPARPAPARSAVAPATPRIQRTAAVRHGREAPGVRTTGSAAPVQRVPVIRPAPPNPQAPGSGAPAPSAAVPTSPLPVTAPQAPPLADRPSATPAPAPAPAVPVVQRRSAAPGDVPAKAVPARGRPRPASATSSATSSASDKAAAARGAEPPPDSGLDLDDLARRLLDPVARLLRAELRRGRERAGRPHDRRR